MTELVESAGGDWNPGNKIVVEVENAFEDGIVVSFIDAHGTEYRGALLSQPSVDLRLVLSYTLPARYNYFDHCCLL